MYNFFDDVVVLSLRNQRDRQEHVTQTLDNLGIPFSFYFADRMKDPKYGSLDSHSKIILKALDAGNDNVLIFEDDVTPSRFYDPIILQHCIDFMKDNKDWDFFYLGYCHPNPRTYLADALKCGFGKQYTQHVYECNCFCWHAYVVSRRGMQKYKRLYESILKDLKNPDNIDVEIQRNNIRKHLNIYMCVPGQFDQLWCGLSTVKDLASKMCIYSQKHDHVEQSYKFIQNRGWYVMIALVVILILCFLLVYVFYR